MDYGIGNPTGRPDFAVARSIVQAAWESGIREFDTAQAYGLSEEVLGQILSELGIAQHVRIISKLHPELNHLDRIALSRAVDQSLERLKIPSLYGLMLHREEFLCLLNQGLGETLNGFVQDGRVMHIGVSVYTPDMAFHSLELDIMDMVQVPTNVLDCRFLKAGVFKAAEGKGKTVYIRSVFLQGLILMKVDQLPPQMDFAGPVLNTLDQLCYTFGISRQEMALGYVKSRFPSTQVVLGVETPDQVKENSALWSTETSHDVLSKIEEQFLSVDEIIINPTLWPR